MVFGRQTFPVCPGPNSGFTSVCSEEIEINTSGVVLCFDDVILGIRRICSTDTFFDQRSRELIKYLTKRGYSHISLQRDANRVRSIPRHVTLQPKEQKSAKTDRTPWEVRLWHLQRETYESKYVIRDKNQPTGTCVLIRGGPSVTID